MDQDERLMIKKKRRRGDAERIWALQTIIKIITLTYITAVVTALAYAEELKVDITKTTQQLSTFQERGSSLNGLLLGHIIIKIDLLKIENKREELMKLQDAINKLPVEDSWTKHSKRLHEDFKHWLNTTIHDTISKMNTSLEVFDSKHFYLIETSDRDSRQLIVGAASLIIGGIIGAVGNYLHQGQVIDVLQQKQGIISHQVQDNLVKLNQEEKDLELIGKALNDTILYTSKMALGIKRLNTDQQYLNTMAATNHFSHKMNDMISALEDLKTGTFNMNLLEMDALKKAAKALDDQARQHNRFLPINSPFDLQKSKASYAYNKDEHALFAILSVPLLSTSERMTLYSHLSIPVIAEDGKIMRITTDESFLAINDEETRTLSYKNMDHCEEIGGRNYICPDSITYKKGYQSCLEGIYFNNEAMIQKNCEVELIPNINEIQKVNDSLFIATSSNEIDLTWRCGTGDLHKGSMKGTYLITLDPDCFLTTDSYTIQRASSPPGIQIESTLLQNPLKIEDWLGNWEDEAIDPQQHLKMAETLMTKIGKPIKVSDIKTLAIFQAQMKKEDDKLSWNNSWFSLTGIIHNGFSTILSFGPIILVGICLYKLVCCYYNKRQGGGGGWFGNRERRQLEHELEDFRAEERRNFNPHNLVGLDPSSHPPDAISPSGLPNPRWRQARADTTIHQEDTVSNITSTTTT